MMQCMMQCVVRNAGLSSLPPCSTLFVPLILRSRCMAVGAPAAISGSGAFSSLKEIDMGDMQ
ncbi:hypothetical protein WL11_04165 [Burkholderia ubonensis]|nr:hypothetical protein WL11_04165 [Burkholderia ubonensis]